MKTTQILLCILTGAFISPLSARANVYATNIKINGNLTSATNALGSPATISYILNQKADLGVTIKVWENNSVVATLPGGTNFGLNSVSWTPTNNGTYSLTITAAASDVSGGTTNWTQISIDGTNTAANYPLGMDVDKNTNSPYYGRVVVGCAAPGTIYGVVQYDGLYKANADGSPADEGAFGYAGYTTNDSGNIGTNQISPIGEAYHSYDTPGLIRIGGDDRIYFIDQSAYGSVVACDILATTNQIVICEGQGNLNTTILSPNPLPPSPAYSNCASSYSNNPEAGYLNYYGEGWGQFDVAGFETGHPAVYLVDTGDYPSAGVWMYHLTNGAADPADSVGTQVVETTNGLYIEVVGSGISVDTSLDVFVGEDREGASDPYNREFAFTNWNNGVLPPEGDGLSFTYTLPDFEAPAWLVGADSAGLTDINDTVINSRFNPTLVAAPSFPVYGGPVLSVVDGTTNYIGGISLLSTLDGSTVVSNLDIGNWYTGAAFDGAGNLYGCSPTTNYWRAWSPPGANTNTTAAIAKLVVGTVSGQFTVSSVSAVSTGGGSSTLTISFTAPGSPAPTAFTLKSAPSLSGPFTTVSGAVITGSGGSYQATATVSSTEFFIVSESP